MRRDRMTMTQRAAARDLAVDMADMSEDERRIESLKRDALDKLRSLETTVAETRRALEEGKLYRLDTTGDLILTATRVDLLVARMVELTRRR